MIAMIDVPLQILTLDALGLLKRTEHIFFIKRPNWPLDISKIKSKYSQKNINTISRLSAVLNIIKKRKKLSHIVIGSHLGYMNRLIIMLSVLLRYELIILDDGNYSCKSPEWLIKKMKKFNNIKWYSSFLNSDFNVDNVYPYCYLSAFSNTHNSIYKDHVFILLADFKGIGLSYEWEKNLLLKIMHINRNKKIIIFPHRRGRFNLYDELNLKYINSDYICFEDWYLKSIFINSILYAFPSSAFNVLREKKIKTILIRTDKININFHDEHFYKNISGEIFA